MSFDPRQIEIVKLYEDAGMTPEDIAEETGFSIETVKISLSNSSETFKSKSAQQNVDEVLNDNIHRLVLQSLVDIAIQGENEGAKVKAAIYLNEEKMNRNQERVERLKDNRIAALGSLGLGTMMLQAKITRAKAAIDQARNGKVIDIQTNTQAA